MAELARRVTARVAMADMATMPPGAALCWVVSRRVSGHRVLLSTRRAGLPQSQKRSARVTAVLIALAALTGSAVRTASCSQNTDCWSREPEALWRPLMALLITAVTLEDWRPFPF